MKNHHLYWLAGLGLLFLMERGKAATGAASTVAEGIPVNGTDFVGTLWGRLSGLDLGGGGATALNVR